MRNKDSRNRYRIFMAIGFGLLICVLLFLFSRIYEISKENALSSANMDIGQRTKDLEFILQECVTELNFSADMVEEMLKSGKTNEEILDYLRFETETTRAVFEGNDTGLYGYIRGEYLDGVGWNPPAGYAPKTRPWYVSAAINPGEVVLVNPYLDAQTGSVLMSASKMIIGTENVVSFDVYLTRLQRQVQAIALDTGWHTLVLSEDGTVVASSIKDEIGSNLKRTTDEYMRFVYSKLRTASYSDFEFKYDKNTYVAFDNAMYGGWRSLVILETDKILLPQVNLYIAAASVFLIVLVYIGIVMVHTTRRRHAAEDVSKQLQSIADIYVSVYKLDFVRDVFEEKQSDSDIKRLVRKASAKPVAMVCEVMSQLLKGPSQQTMDFFNLPLMLERMKNIDVATCEFETNKGWMRSRYIVTERKDSQISSVLWLMENIDAEKRREERLRLEADRDELTGLPNRRAYEKRLRDYDGILPEENLICIVMDANGLKIVNDTYGHADGDELLKGVAYGLKHCFGRKGRAYRIGGDEFFVLLHAEASEFLRIMKDFDETLARWSGNMLTNLSVSYGFATAKEFPQLTLAEMVRIADDRMYDNKRSYYMRKSDS